MSLRISSDSQSEEVKKMEKKVKSMNIKSVNSNKSRDKKITSGFRTAINSYKSID